MRGRYFNSITSTGIQTFKQKQRCQEFRRQVQVRGMSSIGRHSDASADSLSSRCTTHSQHCGEKAWTNNNLGDGCRGREMPAPKESCQSCNQDLDTVLQADTEALSHQIAGHSLGQTALLKHRLGYVLKLVQKPPLGQREVDFYRRVYEDSSELGVHIQLRALIPKFYGVTNIEIVEEGNSPSMKQYLILEDICQGFKHPCVVDVKIGVKTWDPLAPKAKIDHESSKYVGTKGPLGISVTGMQLYDITEKSTIKRDKEFGKHLNVDNVHQAFAEFLNTQAGVHTFLARKLLEQLEQIHNVLTCQKEYAFYSSSLLIAYDASKAETLVTNEQYDDCNERHVSTDVIRVKMIDFAHAFPNNGKLDDNYIFGLNNLMQIIRTIAKCYN